MNSFADCAISFFENLPLPEGLPADVQTLFPFKEPGVSALIQKFYQKYFDDHQQRNMLIGINPGRFGAGKTGINFTAPRQLAEDCGISHNLGSSSELSAEFMYMVIGAFGGPEAFYRHFYMAAASPVGYTKNGKNLNYYDDPQLALNVKPYITRTLHHQLAFGFQKRVAICIGGDKNFNYINALNKEHHFFEEIIVVPHPRFIMQYRRAVLQTYLDQYLNALDYCLHK